jgi:hypothetical protein
VHDLALFGGVLYAAGEFTTPGIGIAMHGPLGWVSIGQNLDGPGYVLEEYHGNLYVGGDFVLAGTITANNIALWSGTFAAAGTGLDAPVRALELGPDLGSPSLYVGGEFTGLSGGPAGTHNYIARWNGTNWGNVGSGMNGIVRCLLRERDLEREVNPRDLFAGGDFTTAGGLPRSHVAVLEWPSTWHAVGTGTDEGTDGPVYALAFLDPCGPAKPSLVVGGDFSTAGVTPANNLATFDGTAWFPTSSMPDAAVRALTLYDDGQGFALASGGSFGLFGSATAEHAALGRPCPDCCGGRTRPRFLATPWPSLGTAVACTSFRRLAPDDPALQVYDLTWQKFAPIGETGWAPNVLESTTRGDWRISRLGEVFGITFDDVGNVFTAHSTVIGHSTVPFDVFGTSGLPGVVYRLDTLSGFVEEIAFLPNFPDPAFPPAMFIDSHPGLGDITWDCAHRRLFVSNFEDGIVYALRPDTGEVVDLYDHGLPDNGSPGFAPLGERIWGLVTHEHRLYYGIMNRYWNWNQGSANEIWSVELGVEGRFLPGTARLEIVLGGCAPSGLSFGPQGSLLVAGFCSVTDSTGPRGTDLSEYVLEGGNWVLSLGNPFLPGQGVVDVDCEWELNSKRRIWTSASILHTADAPDYTDVDGLLGMPKNGGSEAESIWIELDGDPSFLGRFPLGLVVSCPERRILGPMLKTSYCTAAANSVSSGGALMSAEGSNSLELADLTLMAAPTPNQLGLFYYGPNQAQLPFGNGFRCVGGAIRRLLPSFGVGNQNSRALDFEVHGARLASMQTANFQFWYRDPQAGGAFFNLSDGLEIPFWP